MTGSVKGAPPRWVVPASFSADGVVCGDEVRRSGCALPGRPGARTGVVDRRDRGVDGCPFPAAWALAFLAGAGGAGWVVRCPGHCGGGWRLPHRRRLSGPGCLEPTARRPDHRGPGPGVGVRQRSRGGGGAAPAGYRRGQADRFHRAGTGRDNRPGARGRRRPGFVVAPETAGRPRSGSGSAGSGGHLLHRGAVAAPAGGRHAARGAAWRRRQGRSRSGSASPGSMRRQASSRRSTGSATIWSGRRQPSAGSTLASC